MKKHIYFVRHGESEYNSSDVILSHDTNLTQTGVEQAEICAARCSSIPFDVIIASPLVRAKKTAEAISRRTGKQVDVSDLFVEYRYPLGVIGMKKDEAPSYVDMISGVEQRFSGGEVFDDLKLRAMQALGFLESRNEESLVVVSHAMFVYTLLTAMVFGESMTCRDLVKCFNAFRLSNTGITHFVFNDEKPKEKQWRVLTWNDDAHLGVPI